jgi:hypothetical protein
MNIPEEHGGGSSAGVEPLQQGSCELPRVSLKLSDHRVAFSILMHCLRSSARSSACNQPDTTDNSPLATISPSPTPCR